MIMNICRFIVNSTCVIVPPLQYDSKLLKLQKQLAKGQASASSGVGHEIFRKVRSNGLCFDVVLFDK